MFRSITAAELINLLEQIPEDAQVTFATNYGDYHNTQQVHSLDGEVEEQQIQESGYSESGYALVRNERDADPDASDTNTVWVIS